MLGWALNVHAQKGSVLKVSETPLSGGFPVVSAEKSVANIVVTSEEHDVVKIALKPFLQMSIL